MELEKTWLPPGQALVSEIYEETGKIPDVRISHPLVIDCVFLSEGWKKRFEMRWKKFDDGVKPNPTMHPTTLSG